MRCPDCNKFAAYDDSTEPEVDVDLNGATGAVTAQVRIVLTHDECGTELKEASFEFEGTVPPNLLDDHKGDGHSLDAEEEGSELTVRTEGSGRYAKTFYGAEVTLAVRCKCQERSDDALWVETFSDDTQASHMDELA